MKKIQICPPKKFGSEKPLYGNSSISTPLVLATTSGINKELDPTESTEENSPKQSTGFHFSFDEAKSKEWTIEDCERLLTEFIPPDNKVKFLFKEASPVNLINVMKESLKNIGRNPTLQEKINQGAQYIGKVYEIAAEAKGKLDKNIMQGNIVVTNRSNYNEVVFISSNLYEDLIKPSNDMKKNIGKQSKIEDSKLINEFFSQCVKKSVVNLKNGLKKHGFNEYGSIYSTLIMQVQKSDNMPERLENLNMLERRLTKAQIGKNRSQKL